ncbi:fused (3R)-hydroxyacyl-ACP dehydratase subunits HadA/HadB [Nocardia sp. CDC159]|uniref:Fused (3R)-hydroxyacyl-ACP dehydratase subunits HadA/HadB n=1 Tax=Nocardia pulmonis TaxID=2951408 RepID=A0A9X2EAH8_9NOCA|nr:MULTISPECIES: fused (3R)-hydroxyacyl-ACP dehydratase subunits HadA/HadB [Nocardia]MCM6777327.1 fused (3R)-hydroxyacyl-ACP dehydratase subunits HadA/HadB [Nocardia pulmonis]MCM6790212.1 fused (3R)-hydroxyacyl-ACP dehydratase subunits HadA/HadB [Nocardia sp. CDC159]
MPELAPDAPASTALAGRHYRVHDHYEVGREKIREFARAVQNNHPAHRYEPDAGKLGCDGIVAPPTFTSVIGGITTQALLDNVLTDYDLSQMLQTDQVFQIHRPIQAGDRLRIEAKIDSIRRVRGNDFIVLETTVVDETDRVVQVGTTTIVARLGEEIDPNIVRLVEGLVMHRRDASADPEVLIPLEPEQATVAPALADSRRDWTVHTLPSFDDLAVGDQLPVATRHLTRGDLVNYAGVSGDANPIHFSDRAAELAGLPTVVAHGMLTMGLGADYLSSWLGDPTAIETYSVRFSGFVPVEATSPAEIEFSARIKALDPERRTATVLLGATSVGKKLFGRAIAQVRLT